MNQSTLKRANTLTHHLAARMTRPVQVKITGWGGSRKIPKKELLNFAKALKIAEKDWDSLRGGGVGFAVLMMGGPHVQINPKYLDKLEKVVKSQGRRMGPPKKGVGITGVSMDF